jgi:hypothetical protein
MGELLTKSQAWVLLGVGLTLGILAFVGAMANTAYEQAERDAAIARRAEWDLGDGQGNIRIGAVCLDGTRSDSIESGACAKHLGVSRWLTTEISAATDKGTDINSWSENQPVAALRAAYWQLSFAAATTIVFLIFWRFAADD